MTRQQWLWLFIWIFIFFLIFCIWNKTISLTKHIKEPITSTSKLQHVYKKNMNVKIVKDDDNLTISGVVANEMAYNEIIDAYSKVFQIVTHKDLTIQNNTLDDENISEIVANLAEDFSHFNRGLILYNSNKIEIAGTTDNSVTKGSIDEKVKNIISRGVDVTNNLFLEEEPTPDLNISALIDDINDTNKTQDVNETNITTNENQLPPLKNPKDIQKEIDEVMKDRRVQFLFAKDVLTSGSKEIVDNIINILKENNQTKIKIIGHTDSDGRKKDNLALSQKRANSVKKYMIRKKIDKDRLEAIGFGESKPLVKNTSSKNKQINRRVEFKVIGELK